MSGASSINQMNRRGFLRSVAILVAAMPVLQACGAAAPATPASNSSDPSAKSGTTGGAASPTAAAKQSGTATAKPAAAAPSSAGPTPTPGRAAAAGRRTKLTFFLPRGGEAFEGTTKFVEAFEERNPDVGIEIVFAPGHEENPKLFTAVAAGSSPDIANTVDFSIPQWSELGIMQPVDDYFKADKLTADHFFPTVWGPLNYKGKVWGLPYEVDANFPLFWNKAIFRDAGLDPEKAPKTTDEMDSIQAAVTKRDGDKVTRIGFVPWGTYGIGNSVFTWAWVFGGEFVDSQAETVTPDHPQVVAGVQWIVDHAQKVGGPDKVAVLPPGFSHGLIFTNNVAVAPMVIHQMTAGRRVYPNLELGKSYIFVKPPVDENPAWVSGWRNFIPKGAKQPEEAWKFLKFMAVDPEGAKIWYDLRGVFSGWKDSPALDNLRNHPENSIYLDVLATARHVKPLIPVSSFYQTTIQKEVEEALYGRKTVAEALKATKDATTREWNKFRERQR